MVNNLFGKTIRELVPHVRRFAFALTGNASEADDLLHDTIARLLEKGMPEDAHPKKWAFRVCKNIWLDQLRAKKVRSDWAKQVAERDDLYEDGQRVADARLDIRQVEELMQEMPQDQRIVLSMVAIEGLSYKDAAASLEVPIGTVMSRVSRARAYLAERMVPTEGSQQ